MLTETHGPGRPRDPRLDIAITEAAITVLRERGWAGFSMEEVASRAGVSKTTVYRRYSSKIELAFDAWVGDRDVRFPGTDTGSIWGDLTAYVLGSIRMSDNAVWKAILPALLDEARTDPTVQDTLASVWAWRIEVLTGILDRGKARGEIPPETDVQHVREVLDGPMLLRIVVTGEPTDLVFADRLVEDAMAIIART